MVFGGCQFKKKLLDVIWWEGFVRPIFFCRSDQEAAPTNITQQMILYLLEMVLDILVG